MVQAPSLAGSAKYLEILLAILIDFPVCHHYYHFKVDYCHELYTDGQRRYLMSIVYNIDIWTLNVFSNMQGFIQK